MPRPWPFLAALLALGLPVLTHASVAVGVPRTFNVPSAACPTIQSGVDAAANGDTVLVADGTYTGDGNRDIDFHGKSLTVTSQNGPAKTVIDCGGYASSDGSGNHRGFYLHSGEQNVTIAGFTIKNGYEAYVASIPDSQNGGGIFDGNTNISGLSLIDCIITANTAQNGAGGGIYDNNDGGTIKLANCAISGNGAYGAGGGIFCVNSNSITTLTNCSITGNVAQDGGGIHNINVNGSIFSLTNCTVAGNTARTGNGGIYNNNYSGTTTLTNDIIYGNTGGSEYGFDGASPSVSFSDIQGGYPGTGNIDKDPQFVNAAAGDLHLKPGSPCLGKGTYAGVAITDLDGNPRPIPPSIGAYDLATALRYTIVDLGVIPGGTLSQAYAINNKGQVVGISGNNGDHAFIWQNGTMIDLGFPVGDTSDAFAINDLGQVVGAVGNSTVGSGFLWDPTTGYQLLNGFGTSTDTVPTGINNSGQIVGYTVVGLDTVPFLYSNGQWIRIAGAFCVAQAINASGQIAGSIPGQAVRWEPGGTFTSLGSLGGNFSAAYAINNLGQVVGRARLPSDSEHPIDHAFLWDQQKGMQDIGPAGDLLSYGVGLNALGQVVGVTSLSNGGFLYTGNGMYLLKTLVDPISGAGWVLDQPTGINDAGQVVGYGSHNGSERGFLLTPSDLVPASITSFTITPDQVDAPGPSVTAAVAVSGQFTKVYVTCAPTSFIGPSPTFTLTKNGSNWTGQIPTGFLKIAKTNPVTLIATGVRPDNSTDQKTATVGLKQNPPALNLYLSPVSKVIAPNQVVSFQVVISNLTQTTALAALVKITLPANLEFISSPNFQFDNNNTLTWTRQLIGLPNVGFSFGQNFAILSFTAKVKASTPQNEVLTIKASASAFGFLETDTASVLTVDGNLLPNAVSVDDTLGLGILDGDASVNGPGNTPLHATITPKTSMNNWVTFFGDTRPLSLWLEISVQKSIGASYTPSDPTSALLDKDRLLAPSASLSYDATFTKLGDSVSVTATFGTTAAALTLADMLIEILDTGSAGSVPSVSQLIGFSQDILAITPIGDAVDAFTKPKPMNLGQYVQAANKASYALLKLATKDPAAKQKLLNVIKSRLGVEISPAAFDKALAELDNVNNLYHSFYDLVAFNIMTKGNSMTVSFVASER